MISALFGGRSAASGASAGGKAFSVWRVVVVMVVVEEVRWR